MRPVLHVLASHPAAVSMKLLFGCVARVRVLDREKAGRDGAFILVSNHISHFDPPILSSILPRKIDWMAMAELFPLPLVGAVLRTIDAFPASRDRADRTTIRTAIERLKQGTIVGIFPEGGIRDGMRSLLEGAPIRPGASTLAQMVSVPIVPCVILGSDRFYAKASWIPWRRTPIWIAFGNPISPSTGLGKLLARENIRRELTAAFQAL